MRNHFFELNSTLLWKKQAEEKSAFYRFKWSIELAEFLIAESCTISINFQLDADNNFNEENFRNASKSVMPTEVQEFVDDAITKCIASEGPQTKEECDTYPIKLHMCARGGLVADCPAELKDTTDQCTDKLEVKDVPED